MEPIDEGITILDFSSLNKQSKVIIMENTIIIMELRISILIYKA